MQQEAPVGGATDPGWTTAKVDQALATMQTIEDHTIQNGEFIYAVRDASVMLVFVVATLLGYVFAVQVVPTLKRITGKERS